MKPFDPTPPRCVVCDAPNPAGACCDGVTCPTEEENGMQSERKERITKEEFHKRGGFDNAQLFRLQTRGGSWRYYERIS